MLDLGQAKAKISLFSRPTLRLMQLTYFFDVCSMWCALGDEVISELCQRYGARVHVTWKIALINGGLPMEAGPEQELWYYDRCEFVTGRRFNHRWLERKSSVDLDTEQYHCRRLEIWKGQGSSSGAEIRRHGTRRANSPARNSAKTRQRSGQHRPGNVGQGDC